MKKMLKKIHKWITKHIHLSQKGAHNYWKNPTATNKPELYLKSDGRSELLLKLMNKYAKKKDSIIELGCNIGRNLNYLYTHGYKNLTSIEINKNAIRLLRKNHPQLKNCVIHHSSIEKQIKKIDPVDVMFTMAVLLHIHPKSNWIFREMVNKTKKYLIIIEDETDNHSRIFPRNYKKIFESLGLEQVEEIKDHGVKVLSTYVVRVFKKQ